MTRKNKVLAREGNRISLISRTRIAAEEDYLAMTETELPMNTTEQTWIFEVCKETRVGRTPPRLADTLVKIVRWLNHLGSGKIDDSRLESRHNIHHNFRAKSIGL